MDVNDYLQRGYNCEVHALQKRIGELEELLQSATCIYCNQAFNKDSDLAAHIDTCASHPLGGAIARAEEAEHRLASVLDRVGFYVSDSCYCEDLEGDRCEHCEFLRDLRRFAEGRNDE